MTEKKIKSQVWGNRLKTPPDALNISFCAGRDVTALPMADEVLLEYDIWTNLAHSEMLRKAGILSTDECREIKNALLDLNKIYQNGDFKMDESKEDVHINVEHYITFDRGIDAGKKIHTGRSRNDQIAVDMKLYLRDQVIALLNDLFVLVPSILDKASAEKNSLMPGFTHFQPAMLTSAGHWLTSWSQSIIRDITRLMQDLEILNFSPLGAAASFGTSWPIDREYTAELLGFNGVEANTLDCVSSRGENEARIASSISILMNHLSTVSQDIILLSMPYYNMLEVDDRYVTGSSIMPQKRNPDFGEIIRSKASFAHGILVSLLGIQKGAMSGYNRDAQQTKYLIMDLFRECAPAPGILSGVCSSMVFKRDVMLQHCKNGFMNSADVADWMAQKFNLPFRDCYETLSLAVKYSEKAGQLTHDALNQSIDETGLSISISKKDVDFLNTPSSLINNKQHTGSPSGESIEKMIHQQNQRITNLKNQLNPIIQKSDSAKNRCFKE